jgi:hypothetical protein
MAACARLPGLLNEDQTMTWKLMLNVLLNGALRPAKKLRFSTGFADPIRFVRDTTLALRLLRLNMSRRAANSFERLMFIRHPAAQSRNNNQRANDFCARALELVGDQRATRERRSCFRPAFALQHFFLASL